MNSTNTDTSSKRWSAVRIAAVATGALASLLAVGVLGLGAFALWGDSQKDEQGYLSTDSERFGAGTRALATENLDIDLAGTDWIAESSDLGEVRLEVASRADEAVFVGIARTNEVSSYLRDVAHTTVTDIDSDPFEASYSPVAGERKPARPAEAGIWAASTHGTGIQTLNWNIDDGDWSVVVMNEDGSPGVYADISGGAKVPFLDELGWTAIGSGTALLVGGTGSHRPERAAASRRRGQRARSGRDARRGLTKTQTERRVCRAYADELDARRSVSGRRAASRPASPSGRRPGARGHG